MAQAREDSPGARQLRWGPPGCCSGPLQPPHYTVPPPTDYIPLWAYGFITGIAILLVGSVILLIVCMAWRLPGKGQGLWGRIMGFAPLSPLLPVSSSFRSRLCEAVLRGHP